MKSELDIRFRAAHPSEARTLAAMSRLHIEHGLNWRWTPAKVRRHIRDRETMVLVASIDGVTAGFAIMRFGDIHAHLFLLAVRPEFRRQGIGRSMMRWLEKSCRTAGIRQVRLEVRASNLGGRQFYRRLGYRFVGQVGGYYDGIEAAVILARSLIRSA
ncbi:MAG: GNAT family N-acetyltransferase [Woeseia sp.]